MPKFSLEINKTIKKTARTQDTLPNKGVNFSSFALPRTKSLPLPPSQQINFEQDIVTVVTNFTPLKKSASLPSIDNAPFDPANIEYYPTSLIPQIMNLPGDNQSNTASENGTLELNNNEHSE